MKQLQIIGNLGKDAQVITMTDGSERMKFSVAVANSKNETTWFSVLSRKIEGVLPYLIKGKQVFVQGNFHGEIYEGQISYSIYADKIELCGGANAPAAENDTNTF